MGGFQRFNKKNIMLEDDWNFFHMDNNYDYPQKAEEFPLAFEKPWRYSEDTDFEDFGSGFSEISSYRNRNSLSRVSSIDSGEFINPSHQQDSKNGNTSQQSSQAAKCRQLPCRTFISTGSCPYGERCVFLHDPHVVSQPIYIKSKRKSKEDSTVDSFFWPTMPLNTVMGKIDHRNLPHINQSYVVPTPSAYSLTYSNNDVAVYSMWHHFLDFCKVDELSVVSTPRQIPSNWNNPYAIRNSHTGKPRLPIFVELGKANG